MSLSASLTARPEEGRGKGNRVGEGEESNKGCCEEGEKGCMVEYVRLVG